MLRDAIKRLLARSGYRVSRGLPNRLDGIDEHLLWLARQGYAPGAVIDGGANTGSFALAAHKAFPAAVIHMIEPQPACAPALGALAARHGFIVHPVALTAEPKPVRMISDDVQMAETGTYIAWQDEEHLANIEAEGTTLDLLFGARFTLADRVLLKLDLQGHEMLALKGAARFLASVELAIVESWLFPSRGAPDMREMIDFFARQDFDLFDIAGLAGRPRDGRLRQADLVFVRRRTPLWLDQTWV